MKPSRILIDFLPAAGMNYENPMNPEKCKHILKRERRDAAVLRVLKQSGVIGRGMFGRQREVTAVKRQVEAALVFTMTVATQPDVLAHMEPGCALDFIAKVRERTPWAMHMHETLFIEFFHAIVNARQQWHKRPRFPFALDQQSRLAQQIEAFLAVAGNGWTAAVDVDIAFLDIAGGLDDEEDTTSGIQDQLVVEDVDTEMSNMAARLEIVSEEDEIVEGMDNMEIDD